MNPFPAKTVASAVAPLLKVLKNLEAVREGSRAAINANADKITRLNAENVAANEEFVSAGRIIEALGSLINPKE